MVDYHISTQPGFSGGALIVDQVVIGRLNLCDIDFIFIFNEEFIMQRTSQKEVVMALYLRMN